MPRVTIDLERKFDETLEPRPRFVFRTMRTKTTRRVEWAPSSTNEKTATLDVPMAGGLLWIDLFAQTTSRLSPSVALPCRRFVATAVVRGQDIKRGTWVESTDMVDGHVKFRVRVRAERKDEIEDADLAAVERLMQHVYGMCKAANKTYTDLGWAHPLLRTFNTSYVDCILSPVAPCKRPVCGWLDLMHLTTAAPTSMAFYQYAFARACHRMSIDPASTIGRTPALDVEVLCDAAAWIARRSVYVHDTVQTCSGGCVDVDHYGFPRLVDRLDEAGDDCESLSKETMLFFLGFRAQSRPALPDWLGRLWDVAQRYTAYQITGAICGGSLDSGRFVTKEERARNTLVTRTYPSAAPRSWTSCACQMQRRKKTAAAATAGGAFSENVGKLGCHSWLALVPLRTNELWIERGRQWIARQKGSTCPADPLADADDADWPVVFVESTEYTTSAPVDFGRDDEVQQAIGLQLASFAGADAFRFKIPWTTLQGLDRYVYVTTAVTALPCTKCEAREFVFGTFSDCSSSDAGGGGDAKIQAGRRASDLFGAAARSGSRGALALFPVFSPKPADMKAAHEVLEWFAPIPPVPFSKAPIEVPPARRTVPRMYTRPQDWAVHRVSFEAFARRVGWRIEVREVVEWEGCSEIEIDIHYANS